MPPWEGKEGVGKRRRRRRRWRKMVRCEARTVSSSKTVTISDFKDNNVAVIDF